MQTVITRMPWGEIFESSFKVNPAVNPLEDLRQIIAQIREEHNCKDDKLRVTMNAATNQLFTQNPNVINYVSRFIKHNRELVAGLTYGVTSFSLLAHELNLDVVVDNNVITVDDVTRYQFPDYLINLIKVDGLCQIDVSGVNNG